MDVLERALTIAGEDPACIPFVVGPTASGKTELAVRLAARIGAEIVSVDSVQVYRDFDIGSGKPSGEEIARVPHHLVGVIDPLQPMDAAAFAHMAHSAVTLLRERSKRVVVCGGTFLWAKALLFGLAEAPPANADIRTRHRALVEERGHAALHEELARVDRDAAARLHPNDVVRVSRALEVFEVSGTPISEWQRAHAFQRARYDARLIALRRSADELGARIDARVRAMLEAGWIAEVEALLARGYAEARAMGAVGYREVVAHVKGELPKGELVPRIVRSTRIFARRQKTWLNHEPVAWL